jgi:adenine-specific DNA-methyltransferase
MEPYYDRDGVTIYHAEALETMRSMPDSSVDAVITDPPYFRVKGEPWDRQWKSRARFLEWIGALCDEWRRILKPNGSLFVFASPDMAWHVENEIRQRFSVLNSIRWLKQEGWHNKAEKESLRSFLSPWEGIVFAEQFADEYGDASLALHKKVFAPLGRYIQEERERAGLTRNDVEVALGYTSTGDPTRGTALCYRWEEGSSLPTKETYERLRAVLNERGGDYLRREYDDLRREYDDLRRPFKVRDRDQWGDVWTFRTVPPDYAKHPCEKPIALMEHIVRTATKPGALIVDCFAGSGTTLVAARNLDRRAIGIDALAIHCEQAAARLSQSVLPLDIA